MVEDVVRAHAVVQGRVQGVWFRQSTLAEALALGVRGWVRNRPDGAVEVVFEGSRASVECALEYVGTGPERASVESIETAWERPMGEDSFRVM